MRLRPSHMMSLRPRARLVALVTCALAACACATGDLDGVDPPGAEMGPAPDLAAPEMGQPPEMGAPDAPADRDMPAEMGAPSEMGAGEEMGAPADMAPEMGPEEMGAKEEMGPEEDMRPAPCQGRCDATEVCRQDQCVDVCAEAGATCGPVEDGAGGQVMCGACGAGEVCEHSVCLSMCQEASAACGEVLWSGARADCGGCMGASTCHANQCAGAGWRDVAAGEAHTCAGRADGSVRCWGANGDGQIGVLQAGAQASAPVVVSGVSGVVALDAAQAHTCAVDVSQRAWCWGRNTYGQIGNAETSPRVTPYEVPGATAEAAVAAAEHTCLLRPGGQVECVGYGRFGQLGDGTSRSSYDFRAVSGLDEVVALSGGFAHTCALDRPGQIWCWGFNGVNQSGEIGRLGTGDGASRSTPARVTLPGPARGVAAGEAHTCAVDQGGAVWCWGDNTYGQLGDGGSQDALAPRKISALTGAVGVFAGRDHSCAVDEARQLWCWGRNDHGQLGVGHANVRRTPQRVELAGGVLTADAGYYHTCASTVGGQLYCWGKNDQGQLGQGDTTSRPSPARVP